MQQEFATSQFAGFPVSLGASPNGAHMAQPPRGLTPTPTANPWNPHARRPTAMQQAPSMQRAPPQLQEFATSQFAGFPVFLGAPPNGVHMAQPPPVDQLAAVVYSATANVGATQASVDTLLVALMANRAPEGFLADRDLLYSCVVRHANTARDPHLARVHPGDLGSNRPAAVVGSACARDSDHWQSAAQHGHPHAQTLVSVHVPYNTCGFQGGVNADGRPCARVSVGGACHHHIQSSAAVRLDVFATPAPVPGDFRTVWEVPRDHTPTRGVHSRPANFEDTAPAASSAGSPFARPGSAPPAVTLSAEATSASHGPAAEGQVPPFPPAEPPSRHPDRDLDAEDLDGTGGDHDGDHNEAGLEASRRSRGATPEPTASAQLLRPTAGWLGGDDYRSGGPITIATFSPTQDYADVFSPADTRQDTQTQQASGWTRPPAPPSHITSPGPGWTAPQHAPQPAGTVAAGGDSRSVLLAARQRTQWVTRAPGELPRRQVQNGAVSYNPKDSSVQQFEQQVADLLGSAHQGVLAIPAEPDCRDVGAHAAWVTALRHTYGPHPDHLNLERYAWELEWATLIGGHMLRGSAKSEHTRRPGRGYHDIVEMLTELRHGAGDDSLSDLRTALTGCVFKQGADPAAVLEFYERIQVTIAQRFGADEQVREDDFLARLLSDSHGLARDARFSGLVDSLSALKAIGGAPPTITSLLRAAAKHHKKPAKSLLHLGMPKSSDDNSCACCKRPTHAKDGCWSHYSNDRYRPNSLPPGKAASEAVSAYRRAHAKEYAVADAAYYARNGVTDPPPSVTTGRVAAVVQPAASSAAPDLVGTLTALCDRLGVPRTSTTDEPKPNVDITPPRVAAVGAKKTRPGSGAAAKVMSPSTLLGMFTMALLALASGVVASGISSAPPVVGRLLSGFASLSDPGDNYTLWDTGCSPQGVVPNPALVTSYVADTSELLLGDDDSNLRCSGHGDYYYELLDQHGLPHLCVRHVFVSSSVPFPIFGADHDNHHGDFYTGAEVSFNERPRLQWPTGAVFYGKRDRGLPWLQARPVHPTDAEIAEIAVARVGDHVACAPRHRRHPNHVATMALTPESKGKPASAHPARRSLRLGSDSGGSPVALRTRSGRPILTTNTTDATATVSSATTTDEDTDHPDTTPGESVSLEPDHGTTPFHTDANGVSIGIGDRVTTYWVAERHDSQGGVYPGRINAADADDYEVAYDDGVTIWHHKHQASEMRLTAVPVSRGRTSSRQPAGHRALPPEPARPRGRATSPSGSDSRTPGPDTDPDRRQNRTDGWRHHAHTTSDEYKRKLLEAGTVGGTRRPTATERRPRPRPTRPRPRQGQFGDLAHQLHRNWGHPGMDVVMSASHTMGVDVPAPADHTCSDCQIANGTRRGPKRGVNFPVIDPEMPQGFGRHVCADIMHLRTRSVGGKKYALVIVDAYGRYPWVAPLARKSDAVAALELYCQQHLSNNGTNSEYVPIRAPQDPADRGRPHTTFHSDNDSVFLGPPFRKVLDRYNCRLRTGRPNADNDNSICERMIRNLRGKMDTMLAGSGLSRKLWVPALQWSAYLTALLPTTALDMVSPHHFLLGAEGLAEQAYVLARAVPFGTPTYSYNHGRSNSEPKKKLGIFIGINPISLCPRMLSQSTGRIVETKDCTFALETPFGHPYSMEHPTAYHQHGDPADGVDPAYYDSDSAAPNPTDSVADGHIDPRPDPNHDSGDESSESGDDDADTSSDDADAADHLDGYISSGADVAAPDSPIPEEDWRDPRAAQYAAADALYQRMHGSSHGSLRSDPAEPGLNFLGMSDGDNSDAAHPPPPPHAPARQLGPPHPEGAGRLLELGHDVAADTYTTQSLFAMRSRAPPGLPTDDVVFHDQDIGPTLDGFNTPGASTTDDHGDRIHITCDGAAFDDNDEPSPSVYPDSETADGYVDDDSRSFLLTVSSGKPPPPGTTARPRNRVERRVVCGIPVVKSYAEAVASPHWERVWKPAFEKECANVRDRRIWQFFPRGTATHRGHHKKIRVHLVWDVKRHDDGSFKKGKCRAVADGSQMVKGQHYHQSRSPVVRPAMIRTMAATAAVNGWRRRCADVGSAYLWADLDTEVWASVPQEMLRPHERGRDVRIVKSQYGLVQAGLLWYVHLRSTLIDLGYRQSTVDPCVYIKWTPRCSGTANPTSATAATTPAPTATDVAPDPLDPYEHGTPAPATHPAPPNLDTHHVSVVATHVDDIFAISSDDPLSTPLASSGSSMTTQLFDALHDKYELTRDDAGTMYCGCRFRDHPDGSVTVDQNVFVQDLLDRADLGARGSGPRITSPLKNGTRLRPARSAEADEPGNIQARTFPYRRHAASHLYHACMTRPGDSFAAAKLCRYMSAHDQHHVAAMRHFTGYLRDNPEQHLRYARPATGVPVQLHGSSDASLGDEYDGRTTIGFALFVAGAAVEWKTGIARQLAVGTPHAEYIAASELARSAVVIATFLGEFGFPQGPVPLHIDNIPAQTLAESIAPTPLSRYVAQRYHYLRHAVHVERSVRLIGVGSKDQDADGLTKVLIGNAFRRSTDRLTGVDPRTL